MACSVTYVLLVRACGVVAKKSALGLRLCALFLVIRPKHEWTKDVTRRSPALIVLLYPLPILEQCWLRNAYFVHHTNLFIDS